MPQTDTPFKEWGSREFQNRVESLREDLFQIACQLCGRRDLAMDLTQESLIKIFRNSQKYREEISFRAWAFKLHRNHCLDRLKASKQTLSLDTAGQTQLARKSSEWLVLEKERDELLWRAVDDLSQTLRETLLLKVRQGLKYREIAEVLDIPVGTVRSRLNLAGDILRDALKGKL